MWSRYRLQCAVPGRGCNGGGVPTQFVPGNPSARPKERLATVAAAAPPCTSLLKAKISFMPSSFLGRVFDFLVHDRKSSLLCQSIPLG